MKILVSNLSNRENIIKKRKRNNTDGLGHHMYSIQNGY